MLSGKERSYYERELGMRTGYVGDFTDQTFGDFFDDFGFNIHSRKYQVRGTSKANKLRAFWYLEDIDKVREVMAEMMKFQSDDYQPDYLEDAHKTEKTGEVGRKKQTINNNIYAPKGGNINVNFDSHNNNKMQNSKNGFVDGLIKNFANLVKKLFSTS